MEGTIGEVRMFAGNFAPRSWAFCQGQILAISSNSALFSIIGTIYGGDGRTTMALPDLRGRAAIGQGIGPGLSDRRLGALGGAEYHALTISEMPNHNHPNAIQASSSNAAQSQPTSGSSIAAPGSGEGRNFQPTLGYANATPDTNLNVGTSTGVNGGSVSHNNMSPFLAINYIICLQGIFPSRS